MITNPLSGVTDAFGSAWRPVMRFASGYMIASLMVVIAMAVMRVIDVPDPPDLPLIFTLLGAPTVAALLAINATTEDRIKLLVVAACVFALAIYVVAAPHVIDTVASRAPGTSAILAIAALDPMVWAPSALGAFTLLALGRLIIDGDEGYTRPWSSVLGDARWMTMKDAQRLLPADAGVVIGEAYMPFKERRGTEEFQPQDRRTWGSGGKAQILAYDMSFDSTHMLFFAGSGGYKTTSTVIPTARRYTGSMVVLDPAQEIGQQVVPVRQRLKLRDGNARRVIVIDPEADRIQGCDVLEMLRESKRQELVIGAYVNMLLTEKPKATSGADAFFEGNNFGLLSGLLMYVLHGKARDYEDADVAVPTLRQLRTLTALPEAKLKELIGAIYANTGAPELRGYVGDPAARLFVRQSLAPFVTMAQDSWTGIAAQVNTDTKWLTIQSLAATVTGKDFSLKDMPKGGTDVFLQFAGDVVKSNPGVIRVLVGAMFRAMFTEERAKDAQPVLFVLDEVDLLGYMSALEEARDRGRKYGISLMLLYQSVGQIEKHFSRESATAWFDSAAIVSFAAIKSPETSERVSKQCGDFTVEVHGSSRSASWRDGILSRASAQNARMTTSVSLQKRPLILPHEVRQMRSDEQIILVRGKPALRCGRAIFFRRPEMLEGLGKSKVREGAQPKPVHPVDAAEAADRIKAVTTPFAGFDKAAADERSTDDDLDAFAAPPAVVVTVDNSAREPDGSTESSLAAVASPFVGFDAAPGERAGDDLGAFAIPQNAANALDEGARDAVDQPEPSGPATDAANALEVLKTEGGSADSVAVVAPVVAEAELLTRVSQPVARFSDWPGRR